MISRTKPAVQAPATRPHANARREGEGYPSTLFLPRVRACARESGRIHARAGPLPPGPEPPAYRRGWVPSRARARGGHTLSGAAGRLVSGVGAIATSSSTASGPGSTPTRAVTCRPGSVVSLTNQVAAASRVEFIVVKHVLPRAAPRPDKNSAPEEEGPPKRASPSV
jgi:hypothetical protein